MLFKHYIRMERSAKNLAWFPLFIIIYNFVGNLSNDIYLPSMPHLVEEFSTSKAAVQMTLTAWFAGAAIPQLIFGPLSDRIGRKLLLLIGGVDFLFATLLCILAPNISTLIFARFLQGVGVCSLNIASFAAIRELYDYNQTVKIFSYVSTCGSLAPLMGPVIGGYLFILLGWQINFILVFVVGLIAIIGLWFVMPESLMHFDRNALSPKTFIKNYAGLITNTKFIKHLLVYGLLLGGIVAYLSGSPFLIIKVFKVPPQYFGFSQMPTFLMYIIGSIMIGKLVNRFGSHRMIRVGLFIIALSILLMVLLSFGELARLFSFILVMMLYSFGFSLCGSSLTAEAMVSAQQATGSAAALLGFCMAVANTISSLAVGIFYNSTMYSVTMIIATLAISSLMIYFVHGLQINEQAQT